MDKFHLNSCLFQLLSYGPDSGVHRPVLVRAAVKSDNLHKLASINILYNTSAGTLARDAPAVSGYAAFYLIIPRFSEKYKP
jgi:hypothetical protein